MTRITVLLLGWIAIQLIQAQNVVLHGFEQNNTHVLEWAVTECGYVSHFEIERSTDESRFEMIYTQEIKSYDCNGNYSYTINSLPKAYKYTYRIKAYLNTALPIISNDFTVFYKSDKAEITQILFETNRIYLSVIVPKKNTLNINIIDILGRLHYTNAIQVHAGKQDIELQTNILQTGIYFIHITDSQNRLIYQNKYILKNN